jgi:hypothetical protein
MASVAGLVVLAALLWAAATQPLPDSVPIERMRDFYGALTVYATKQHDPQLASLTLMHGSIIHGKQFTHPDRRRLATTYFGPASGVGKAFADLASRQPLGRRVGVVGLGAGTLAAYGRPGDEFKFYELSPNVAVVARDRFTFLSDSPAGVEIVLGDARVSLEREAAAGARPNQFDLLVLDAFSSDAIPVHLLTAEAFDLYRRHLAGEAVVAVHISNQHLDLEPVVARQAERLGWAAVVVHNEDDEALGTLPANWVLLSARPERLRGLSPRPALSQPHVPLWTDEYASLLPVMK